jgi:hypothetical protein
LLHRHARSRRPRIGRIADGFGSFEQVAKFGHAVIDLGEIRLFEERRFDRNRRPLIVDSVRFTGFADHVRRRQRQPLADQLVEGCRRLAARAAAHQSAVVVGQFPVQLL